MADDRKEQEREGIHRSIADDLRNSVDGWDFLPLYIEES